MKGYDIHKAIDDNTDYHRTIPFWSWNGELEPEELKTQIRQMKAAGIGGYFMHARGGLTTPYMQEGWMKAIAACLDEGEAQGMESWGYDENGWPSGFADGEVPALGEEYQQKGLDFCVLGEKDRLPERTLGVYRLHGDTVRRVDVPSAGDVAVYLVVNQYYIDALNAEAITRFIECTHERYYASFRDDFGTRMQGFFTDEPQYANGFIPWSPVLEEAFSAEWGYDLRDKLGALFLPADGEKAFRWQYYQTAARLFHEGFIKQLGDWCRAHDVQLTGHLMLEDSLLTQLRSTGGVMDTYEYFDMPGIDWLGRSVSSPVIPKQLGSVATQLGKERTLTESFALCGWDVSFNELRWIAQWQYVNGVNLICQHLSAYSLQGFRKRDYPASLHIQSPWFDAYRPLQDYFARTGAALSLGEDATDVLLLQPLGDVAGNHNRADEKVANDISSRFDRVTTELSGMHLLHHYGDETVMKRHGRVQDGKLYVGQKAYRAVILPYCESIAPSTVALLTEYIHAGGQVIAIGHVPMLVGFEKKADWDVLAATIPVLADVKAAAVALYDAATPHVLKGGAEESAVHVLRRMLPDGRTLLYLTSLSMETLGECTLKVAGQAGFAEIDLTDNSERVLAGHFDGEFTSFTLSFAAAESHLLVSVDADASAVSVPPTERLAFLNNWQVAERTPNALTLDMAEYRIDYGEWQPKKAIILIQKELLELRHPCHIDLRLTFKMQELDKIGNLELVMEQPELYSISLNGQKLPFADNGWYCDKSFRRCLIRGYVKEGENTLILSGEFFQRQKVYDVLFGDNVHEVERNKLTYDTELESLYLLGDFAVNATAPLEYCERRGVWAGQDFIVCPQADTVDISNITTQGYWFFAGKLRLKQTVTVTKRSGTRYVVEAEKLHVPAARVYINGAEAGLLYIAPFRVDVTDWLMDGENTVEIELLTGNRNLLGPHHRPIGESYMVSPNTFTDAPEWWVECGPRWRDDYCFVTTGVIW